MKTFNEYMAENEITEKIFQGKGKIGKLIIELPVIAKDKEEAVDKFRKRVELEQKNDKNIKGELTDIIIENINKNNWKGLKKFMQSQPGFVSWDIEKYDGYPDELVITYEDNKQARNALMKSHKSNIEITAFGEASNSKSEVRVILSEEAMKGLNESSLQIREAKDYEIKDGKVLITKKNYSKKPRDYKGGKKGSETLLVLDKGVTTLMPVKFIVEGIQESLNEALDAKKVYDYYISTMNDFKKFGEYYGEDSRYEDKVNRRILTDYAGDPKVLKDIYRQLANMTNTLDEEMTKFKKIIG